MNSYSAQKYIMQSDNKSTKSKKITNPNIDISSQSFSTIKKSHNKKEKYLINCNKTLDKKEINKYNNINDLNTNINNDNEEELAIIKSLWDDLGIYEDYQDEFKNYIKQITNEEKKNEILNLEKSELRKYREALLKLSAEISNRESNVIKLKKLCKELDKYELDKNRNNLPSDIFENIQKNIKYYRINTVNVINKIIRLREVSSYNELNKKWDPAKANRAYLYNKFYTIKMFNDIKFINNSILFNYLVTENDIKKTDLFLSNCKYIKTNDGNKLTLSISLELQSAINKCKYIILQDTLFNNIRNDQKLFRQRNIMSPKTLGHHKIGQKKSMSEISLINDKDEKKYFEMFGHKKVNLSRTLYYLKRTMGNQYENMFFNSNNQKNNEKKNMEVMNKFFSFKNGQDYMNINNIDINLKNSNMKDINPKEYKLKEQLNKNNEDFKSLDVEKNRINKIKTSDIKKLVNFESNIENITNKENNIIDETEENNLLNKSKEGSTAEKKDNKINIINNNIENKININNNKEIKELSNKSNDKIINNINNINNKDNKKNKNNNSIELNQENNNKKIIESKPIEENKEIKTEELIEDKEKKTEEKEKEKDKGEFEEKSLDENDNENNVINLDDKGEFQEISLDNDNKKLKDEKSPKVKLLQFRRYTEEEMKKINRDEDDDDFMDIDYNKI